MLQVVEAGIGNTSGTAPAAKIFKLPDRAARGAPDGEDRAPEGPEFVRAAYEAAGGSCAKPVEMRPLARRLGLDPRTVENLAMRLQAERLVRVVSMANGLLRLTPEGARTAESVASDPQESAGSGPPDPAAPTGAPRAGGGNFAGTRASSACPVVGRGALRELEGLLHPLKADLDRLDLDGALDEEQRSELAAEIRTIEAQLGSPRPKRRIVVAALESVAGVAGSADDAAGGAGSERISRAIDAFLDETGGTGQTGRAAPGVGGGAGEAAGKAQAGRADQGARNGAGLARPGSDLADGDGLAPRRPEEESAATVRAREAGGVRVRKWVRDDGGQATEQARGACQPVGEGANEAVGEVGQGAGSAVEDVGDAADRATDREAEAGRRVLRVVDEDGDILRTALNEEGEVVDEDVIGNVADLPVEEYPDDGGGVAGRTKDESGTPIRPRLGEDGGVLDPRIPPPAGAEETVEESGRESRSGSWPQEARRQTEDQGAGDLLARFLRQTVDGARDFHGDSLGKIGGRLRGDRVRLEGLAEQVPEGDAEARIRALIDFYSAIEESLDRAARGPGAADTADQWEQEDEGGAGRQADQGTRAPDETATTVRRVVDEDGDILRTALNEEGEVVDEDVVGNVAELPIEDEYVDERGRTVAGVKDDAGNAYWLVLDEEGSPVDAGVVESELRDAGWGPKRGVGKRDTPEQRSNGHATAGEGRPDGIEPDVLLDVPNLEIDELNLKAENLSARVSLLAELANFVKIDVGLDARLDKAELGLKGAKARANFGVRLKRILDTFDRALGAIDRNPQILDGTLGGASGGDALHGKGSKDTPKGHGGDEFKERLGGPDRDGLWGFEGVGAVK